jgi:hypothetical protein
MKQFINQSQDQVKKRRLAVLVTSVTSMILAGSMFLVSTLKPSDIFGANHPKQMEKTELNHLKSMDTKNQIPHIKL